MEFLEKFKIAKVPTREILINLAKTSLRTKLAPELADIFTEIVTDAVLSIAKGDRIDLNMIEIMAMKH